MWDDGIKRGLCGRCKECRSPASKSDARNLPPHLPDERFPVRRHAVVRYHQRVRPDISTFLGCWHAMVLAMAEATLQEGPPVWYEHEVHEYEGYFPRRAGYLIVTPTLAFPLSRYGGQFAPKRNPPRPERVMVATVLIDRLQPAVLLPEGYEEPTWVRQQEKAVERRIARRARWRESQSLPS